MNDTIIKNRKLINSILTILGIVLFICSVSLSIYDYVLEQNAVKMNATIKSLDYSSTPSTAMVEYKVQGERFETKIKVYDKNLTVKDKTLIKYNLKEPNKLVSNEHGIIIIVSIILSIILLVTNLNKFINRLNEDLRINKLYKKGIYIEANIVEVFTNSNGKKGKGKLPYKLRCKYLNPKDNLEYAFESQDTYVDLNEVIKSYGRNTAVVILEKENTKNYYVDLGSIVPQMKLIDPRELMSVKNSNPK